MWLFIVGLMIGGFCGIVLMSLLIISREEGAPTP